MEFYLLYRNNGFLVFNDGSELGKYWLSFQGQYHGGPEIFKEITKVEFDELIAGVLDIGTLTLRYPECYGDAERGKRIDEMYNLTAIQNLHELSQYPAESQNFISRIVMHI